MARDLTTLADDNADECPHGFSDRQWCALCSGRDGGEQAARERNERLCRISGVIPSMFGGVCGRCGEPYPVGTAIRADDNPYLSPAVPRWIAECCLTDTGEIPFDVDPPPRQ